MHVIRENRRENDTARTIRCHTPYAQQHTDIAGFVTVLRGIREPLRVDISRSIHYYISLPRNQKIQNQNNLANGAALNMIDVGGMCE